MRTIIELADDQAAALDALCERTRISRAEAVRRAVALLLQADADSAADSGFGAWAHKKLDGLEYQQRLREEWPEHGQEVCQH